MACGLPYPYSYPYYTIPVSSSAGLNAPEPPARRQECEKSVVGVAGIREDLLRLLHAALSEEILHAWQEHKNTWATHPDQNLRM